MLHYFPEVTVMMWINWNCDSNQQHSEEGPPKAPGADRCYLPAGVSKELTDFLSEGR
jgi:hypothetical protein